MIHLFNRLFYLLVLMLLADWVSADHDDLSVVLLGTVWESPLILTHELDPENLVLSGVHHVSANVHFKTFKTESILDSVPLRWGKEGQKQTVFLFKAGERPTKVDLQSHVTGIADHSNFDSELSITDFDELWIDYRSLVPENSAKLGIELDFSENVLIDNGKGGFESQFTFETVILRSIDALNEVDRVDMESSDWVPKDSWYLIRRVLGFDHDTNWRYVEKEEALLHDEPVTHVVLQRRFSQNLMKIDALEIVAEKNTPLGAINIRLEFENDSNSVVPWQTIPKLIRYDDVGRQHTYLLIGELLATQFPEKKNVILKELIIFLMSNSEKIVHDRPIKMVRWLSLNKIDQKKSGKETENVLRAYKDDVILSDRILEKSINLILVDTREISRGKGRKRLKVMLRDDIAGSYSREKIIESAKLWIKSESDKQLDGSGIEIESIRGVRFHRAKQPRIAFLGNMQLEQWGIRLEKIVLDDGTFPWPLIDTYLPFTNDVQVTDRHRDGWIDISWPVELTLQEGMYMYPGLTDPFGNVQRMRLTAMFDGVALEDWTMSPASSVKLSGNWGLGQPVDRILIRVFFDSQAKNIVSDLPNMRIDDLVFFKIKYLSFFEALDQKLVQKNKKRLDLILTSLSPDFLSDFSDGELTTVFVGQHEGSTTLTPLVWGTTVDLPTGNSTTLTMHYLVPSKLTSVLPCWLEITMSGDEGRRRVESLCSEKSSGQKSIQVPRWVNRIDWQLKWPTGEARSAVLKNNDVIRFSADIRQGVVTVRDIIAAQPVLGWKGDYLSPDLNNLGAVETLIETLNPDGWLTLGNLDGGRLALVPDVLEFPDHSWLELRHVVLERKQPFTLDEWNYAVKTIQAVKVQGHPSGGGKWIFYAAAVVAVWLLTRRVSLQGMWLSTFGSVQLLPGWGPTLFWLSVSVGLYSVGVLGTIEYGGKYGFTFGGIAAVLAWKSLISRVRPVVTGLWPKVAERIYGGPGTDYFLGVILIFLLIAVTLSLKFEMLAEQLALIGYYMLVFGVALELQVLFKTRGVAVNGKI